MISTLPFWTFTPTMISSWARFLRKSETMNIGIMQANHANPVFIVMTSLSMPWSEYFLFPRLLLLLCNTDHPYSSYFNVDDDEEEDDEEGKEYSLGESDEDEEGKKELLQHC